MQIVVVGKEVNVDAICHGRLTRLALRIGKSRREGPVDFAGGDIHGFPFVLASTEDDRVPKANKAGGRSRAGIFYRTIPDC